MSANIPPNLRNPREMGIVSKAVEGVLVVAFVAEVVGCVLVAGRGPGCPLSPNAAAAALVLSCLSFYYGIVVIKSCGRAVSRGRLETLYPSEPNRRHNYCVKFGDQSWQLVVHALLSALAYYILRFEDGGVAWLDDHTSLWLPEAKGGAAAIYAAPSKPSVQLLYLLQAAAWIVTAVSHVWLEARHKHTPHDAEANPHPNPHPTPSPHANRHLDPCPHQERHKDYLMMLVHHVVTLALILLSYHFNFVRLVHHAGPSVPRTAPPQPRVACHA